MSVTYHYDRHLTSGDEIRLIRLLPGHRKDPIKCDLLYCSLAEKKTYEALSYTWGSAFNDDHPSFSFQRREAETLYDLHIEDAVIKITSSLHHALLRMRKAGEARLIWADAISIDQTHDEEKSWQIKMMQNIYQQASQVVIWLGPSDSDSEVAIRTLESGYRHYLNTRKFAKLGQIQQDHPPPSNESEFQDQLTAASFGILFGLTIQSNIPIPKYPIEAVANLLNRAYWGRGWCWQEFCVASKMCIMCGDETLQDGDVAFQIFLETWDRLKEQTGYTPRGMDHRPWAMMELRRSHQNVKYIDGTGFVDDGSLETPAEWMLFKARAKMNVCDTTTPHSPLLTANSRI